MAHSNDLPDHSQVSLSYLAPPPDLTDLFGPIYYFVANRRDVSDHTRADYPQFRIMLSGQGHYVFSDGRHVTTPTLCLLGATNAATHFVVDGPLRVLGVSILPLGWAALSLGDASAMADDVRDFAQLRAAGCHNIYGDMRAAIDVAADVEQAATLLWRFLRDNVRTPTAAERAFVMATDSWLADESSPRVDALQAATGLSARQVARLCNRFYGAPPKYLARKYRTLRCASILAHEELSWADLAPDAFYDQSHFIREFKHFIGLTPNQLRANASLVLRLTMGRRDVQGDIAKLSRIS